MTAHLRSSDVLQRARTYPAPPRRFDPNTASQADLLRYGFPQRPDPERTPQLARLWKRAFVGPAKFDRARLSIDTVMGDRDPLLTAAAAGSSWAGAVKMMSTAQGSDFTQPATMVFAQWQLPYVWPITPDATMAVAFWVGLDGFVGLSEPASKQVLQAGVTAQVDPPSWPLGSPKVTWYAWTEWYTALHKDPRVKLDNFPVAPGDQIFAVVCAPQPDFGFVSMLNITRGIGRSVGFPAPESITAQGTSAEWIVEIPPQSPKIPLFCPVTFSDCTAGSLQHGVFNLDGALALDNGIPPGFGVPASPFVKASIATPTTAVIELVAVDWF